MIKKLLYAITVLVFLWLAYLTVQYFRYINERNASVIEQGQATTNQLRDEVDRILTSISDEGARLADLFGSNEYTQDEIIELIKESSLSIPEIQGVTACYEPDAFNTTRRLFCPYYNKGSQDYILVEDTYDYSVGGQAKSAWYTNVRDNGAQWVEPYYATAALDWYVDYGIPFYYKDGPKKGEVRGTITMSFVCSGFKNLVHSLSLGKTGYGMITSTGGKFLAHPNDDYIGVAQLDTLFAQTSEKELLVALESMKEGESGNVEYVDEEDNALFFYDKIPSSGWGIGLMFFKNDLLNDSKELNRKYIQLSLVLSLLFILILASYYNKDYLDESEIWQLSIIGSLLLIANISLIGYLQHITTSASEQIKSQPISDMGALKTFVSQRNSRAETLKTKKPISIPTGLYIERMEFEDSYNLNVGGTIWQKYPLDAEDNISVGFRLPQMSPFAEASYIEEAYRKRIEGNEDTEGYLLVGWDIRVTLRLNLTYEDYPFDKRMLSIEILPLNNIDNLLFTPDLSSYSYTNPSQKSGLNSHIQIAGTTVQETFFNYSLESYDADFGYGQKGMFEEVPVLHYNINIKRKLLNAFITYLIPIFVTLIMVFILIYATGKTEERQGIIESMAAFFFVLIFSHIDLRKEVETAELIYMEYFYFIAYFMLIFSTANLITYAKNKSRIFDFNNNQIFKAIFFPLFLMILLILTVFKFY